MEVKVWEILQGPIAVEDFKEDYEPPEGSQHLLVCRVEIDGQLEEDNFWFEDLNDAYEWVKYFSKTAEPLIIDTGSDPEYN